ncbi:uncharacterized protein BDZ99DRAFT_310919 [Mytilinidion resinicola]|uniref:Uncharacterized protein n=1 Tax=Mytilinidion resinicola TaxID=574789 RepID=A0A6A6YR21_9PEZI|nr:uncharacterized protein BDZ99DRAFT_310919 [Mytilinidion resinicola]KAF2810405.1 hypothetical protein BDZ99DRAFT_310919 [Mytilinidion resinicola]
MLQPSRAIMPIASWRGKRELAHSPPGMLHAHLDGTVQRTWTRRQPVKLCSTTLQLGGACASAEASPEEAGYLWSPRLAAHQSLSLWLIVAMVVVSHPRRPFLGLALPRFQATSPHVPGRFEPSSLRHDTFMSSQL